MRPLIMILFLAVLLAAPTAAQQQGPSADDGASRVSDRYNGPLVFATAQGLVHGNVVARQWQITNGETAEIPHQGLLIVQVRSGSLVAESGGKREHWTTSSFWSIPAGQRLIIHTEHSSVVLQTVDVIERQPAD